MTLDDKFQSDALKEGPGDAKKIRIRARYYLNGELLTYEDTTKHWEFERPVAVRIATEDNKTIWAAENAPLPRWETIEI
jgi:hypothetical protein